MKNFATYLHPQTTLTSVPISQIQFEGYSYPYFSKVRQGLEIELGDYPVLPVRMATYEDYLRVHKPDYLNGLRSMAEGRAVFQPLQLGLECTGLEYCLPGYLYGLGGMMEAVDQMKKGILDRAYCFSLPGHHAYPDRGHGYCLLNPLAVAARYAQEQGFAKVLIVDWDLHHADGTQFIFREDSSVYCISIHSALDLYMALACGSQYGTTTYAQQIGHCNIPLMSESFDDSMVKLLNFSGVYYRHQESITSFQRFLDQIPWEPDLILIFSGYDSHIEDQGKGITNWTDDNFKQLTRAVVDLASKSVCPVLSVHGGGYNLPVVVSAAKAHVDVLAAYSPL